KNFCNEIAQQKRKNSKRDIGGETQTLLVPILSRKPFGWNNFDCACKVEKINVGPWRPNKLHINCPDKHESTFTLEWLKEHSFCKERHNEYIDTWYRPRPKPWSKEEFPKILKKFQYKDIMENDEALKEWLETLAVEGVSMLKTSPLDIGTVKTICNRVGSSERQPTGNVAVFLFLI
ncbi:hypothetical protein DOY81_009223, partial [Sarcophaga bullata]